MPLWVVVGGCESLAVIGYLESAAMRHVNRRACDHASIAYVHVSEESREEDILKFEKSNGARDFLLLWIGPVIMYLRLCGGCCGVCMDIGMG